MTIARRPGATIDTVATPTTTPAPSTRLAPPGGMPVPVADRPAPDAGPPPDRLRRCTYRRLDRIATAPDRREPSSYEVMCLLTGRDGPLRLGDIDAARPICEACTAPGIFRPDED